LRQAGDKIMNMGLFGGGDNFRRRRPGAAHGNIVKYAIVQQNCLLGHHGDLLAKLRQGKIRY
tara:strand:- start:606 stop:791 length:186 start_codon:yes stop_codon:yes gene_type:complete